MADTVVSMARSMLGGAIRMAASAAATETSLLMGVRKDIWFIRDELETMHAFLVVAETTENKNILVKVWAKQVRDLAYGIEDCLDEFMVHVGNKSLCQQLFNLRDRHRVATQIRDLKSRVEEVSNRNARYNMIKTEASSSSHGVDSHMEDVRNQSPSNIDEAKLVGFAKPKEELIKLIDVKTEDGLAKVICVVGMGGLGKTTLARKIYENKNVIRNTFFYSAWIIVSQSFSNIDLLKNMISQFFGNDSLRSLLHKLEGRTVQVEDLANYLRQELSDKRYFIVLDDLWTIDAWKWIHSIAFPSNNIKGSRIIVTTRDVGLAKQITHESLIYPLQPLESADATNLLLIKTGKNADDMDKDEILKNIVEKLVRKCACLPLALLTIGGILAKKNVNEWNNIYDQIPLEIETNPSLEAMRRMVTLSYNHLPSHLKSCFLYLSIFPEDFEIKKRRLIERWIAEGFVRSRGGVNVGDVGESYFIELINRSMIQPSRVNIEGIVKSCRVHDIMHDVMVSISRDEHFVCLAEDGGASVAEKFRHVAYNGSKCQQIGLDWSHVRSLTLFGERPMEPSPSLCSADLRMVRVLDLEDAQFGMTQKDMNNIELLRHLKYLHHSPRENTSIYKFPRSIGRLQGLQSLDLRRSHISTLPSEISKLRSLRSIRCMKLYGTIECGEPKECLVTTCCLPIVLKNLVTDSNPISMLHMDCSSRCSRSRGVKVPRGIGNLKELQELESVDIKRTSSKAIRELGHLVQLRKLSVDSTRASEKKCKILCASVEKMSSLRSLYVDAVGYLYRGTLEWLHSISSPPSRLRSLRLTGSLRKELPMWIGSLTHLVKIYLEKSRLKEGSNFMEMLGELPSLMLLTLYMQSYVGKKLVFKSEAFPNLKELRILFLDKLKEVSFDKGTAPNMATIEINYCTLTSGIIGINHLLALKDITLGSSCRVVRLGVLQGEVDAHTNHAVLRLEEDRFNKGSHDLPLGESSLPSDYDSEDDRFHVHAW